MGHELQPDVWPLEGVWTYLLGTTEPWKGFELGRVMVSWGFGKMPLASVLEGVEREAVSTGKHQRWERGVCTRVEQWKGEEVQVGEKLNWLALAGTGWLQRVREGDI